ncbi:MULTISPECIES: PfkB family carbohydrate kinase [Streptomyces diastaticus group]|uniref:Ribokinase n=1 Tax=Streptomyces gougerotii TaxID=53448 RepID=A0A8H9LIY2_9ACTN|nr:PfkB family carbohydrate kinase [Streptomyces gougerotii]GFH75955.1 ribokinase [Streptomyces gougerotii]GGU60750.1 ribokinase [Streptomyces gougerotii]
MTHIVVFGSVQEEPGARADGSPGGRGARQAVAAARAGAAVSLVGAVGTGAYGERLRAGLVREGVGVELLRTVPGPSGTARVAQDRAGSRAVVVPGADAAPTGTHPADAALIGTADVLLLSADTPLPGVAAAARAAGGRGVRTVLAPSPVCPPPDELLAATGLLVVDEDGAASLSGRAEPYRSVRALLELVPEAVVTLGTAGYLWAVRGGEPTVVPGPEVRVVDAAGADDVFAAALTVAVGEGRPMAPALEWATAAAALSAGRPGAGASSPYRAEIDARCAAVAS